MENQLNRLEQIASALKDGKDVPKETVRTILSWYGAKRRGYYITQKINGELSARGLSVTPALDGAYIDGEVQFYLGQNLSSIGQEGRPAYPGPAPSLLEPQVDSLAVQTVQIEKDVDPTYRVSRLRSANSKIVLVTPDESVERAATLMLSHDYSQLPVMVGEHEVRGLVSWRSIGRKMILGLKPTIVGECMEEAHVIGAGSSLFGVIDAVIKHECVLVRDIEQKISGIITTSDLSEQFHHLGEPFLLLGEIENHIRRILDTTFCVEDYRTVSFQNVKRPIEDVSDLTLGQCLRLLGNPENWRKIKIAVDGPTFIAGLEQVRRIRNDVMHFDPDGVPSEDMDTLRKFSQFLQKLKEIGVT